MSLRVFPDMEQRSDAWYDARRGMVTASAVGQLLTVRRLEAIDYDCPACAAPAGESCKSKRVPYALIKTLHHDRAKVAALGRHESPLVIETADSDTSTTLTELLAAERVSGFTDPTFISNDMFRGIDDEPRAVAVYSEHYEPVKASGFMVRDDWGFEIGYSPDGLVGADGLVEVKSRRQRIHLRHVIADEVPASVMPQLQCALLVSGRKWIDYISYSGGMALWTKRVTPDERWFDAIVLAVNTFERAAEQMADKYLKAVEGLPATERVVDLELVF